MSAGRQRRATSRCTSTRSSTMCGVSVRLLSQLDVHPLTCGNTLLPRQTHRRDDAGRTRDANNSTRWVQPMSTGYLDVPGVSWHKFSEQHTRGSAGRFSRRRATLAGRMPGLTRCRPATYRGSVRRGFQSTYVRTRTPGRSLETHRLHPSTMEPGREAHLPAEQSPAGENPRLPAAHADSGGPGDHRRPSSQGPRAAVRLSRAGSHCLPREGFRMLPPQNRLRRTRDHQAVTRRGVRGGSRLVVVHVLTGGAIDPQSRTRSGFAVGAAVGGAVTRNAVRRRLRHLIRDRLDRIPVGSLVVVRAQAAAGTAPTAELARDLDTALDRALSSNRRRTERTDRR